MNHDDCTCCRHWRRFEQQRSGYEPRERPAAEIVGEGPEFEQPIGLLPPRPSAPLAR